MRDVLRVGGRDCVSATREEVVRVPAERRRAIVARSSRMHSSSQACGVRTIKPHQGQRAKGRSTTSGYPTQDCE